MIRLSRKVLCLDWDKRALRVVVARVGAGEMQLEDAHAHHVPHNVDSEDPQAMGSLIAQSLQRHRIKQSRVIVDVPRDKAVINRLTVPPTPRNELAAAVRFQAMRELPFPTSEAQIDYVVTQQNEQRLATQVLLAAVRREALDRLRETCQAAGLTPARIGLRPYANMIAVMHLPAMQDRRVLFVDVGPTMTEIDVMVGSTLAFSRAANVSVPFHGGVLVAEDSRVSSKAELSEVEQADAAESAAVDELLVEITRTLQAYRATEGAAEIDQIVVAGGTGIEHTLVDAVDERFGLPATLFDPTVSLAVDEQEAPKLRAFAATLGLAWGLSKEGLLALDFLNPKKPVPPRQVLKRRLRFAGIAAAVLVLGATGALAWDWAQHARELEDLRGQNRELAQRVHADTEIDIKSMEAEAWAAEARTGLWLDHLLWLTRNTIEPGKEMIVSDAHFKLSPKPDAITLQLLCSGWEVANDFGKRLNELRAADGRPVYKADQRSWQRSKTVDPKFKFKMDCRIELLQLSGRPSEEQREEQYEKLQELG